METQMMNEREERRSALDDFAREGESKRGGEVVAISPFAAPTDRVFGAQQVAVFRDETRVLGKLKALAAAAGTDWYYRYPVKKKVKDQKTGEWVQATDWIEGPSIKLANDLARIYGNCDIDVRVQDLGASWLIYARFMDLETGFSLVRPFQQQKGAGKIGGGDDARRQDIAFQIGASKAIRNVVANALQTFADFAFDEAKNALVDKIGKDLANWRTKIAQRIVEHVELKRVEMVIGRVAAEWLAPDIARIIAMMKAVSDGMASIDDTFPPLNGTGEVEEETTGHEAKTAGKVDEFANKKEGEQQPAKAKPAAEKPEKKAAEKPAAEQQQKPAEQKQAEQNTPESKSEAGPSSPPASEQPEKQAPTTTGTTASGKPSPELATPPKTSGDGDAIAKAERMGRAAYRKNFSRNRGLPVDFKAEGRETEKEAWYRGFDAEADEDAPEPGSKVED